MDDAAGVNALGHPLLSADGSDDEADEELPEEQLQATRVGMRHICSRDSCDMIVIIANDL